MRCYDAGELHDLLTEQGFQPVDETEAHRLYEREGHLVVIPKPDARGLLNADEVDQIIADRWIPLARKPASTVA